MRQWKIATAVLVLTLAAAATANAATPGDAVYQHQQRCYINAMLNLTADVHACDGPDSGFYVVVRPSYDKLSPLDPVIFWPDSSDPAGNDRLTPSQPSVDIPNF